MRLEGWIQHLPIQTVTWPPHWNQPKHILEQSSRIGKLSVSYYLIVIHYRYALSQSVLECIARFGWRPKLVQVALHEYSPGSSRLSISSFENTVRQLIQKQNTLTQLTSKSCKLREKINKTMDFLLPFLLSPIMCTQNRLLTALSVIMNLITLLVQINRNFS